MNSEIDTTLSERFTRRHWLVLALAAVVYIVVTVANWSRGYIDFGDGNYMYIGRRIAEGAVVYRDILAPQPPCHLFLGALVVKIAALFGAASPLYFFRGTSLILHLATFALIVLLGRRAWGRPTAAVVAGLVWLWLPIGYWWSIAWQSEPLENFFLLAMILLSLRGNRWSDVGAGIFAALAGLTNATAAPFLLVLIIYMAIRAPRRAVRMAIPCVVLVGVVTAVLQIWTDGAYLNNVVFNQVGTYPNQSLGYFLQYAVHKLTSQGFGVLSQEGAFLFLALIGFARFWRESPLAPIARGGLGWFFLATLSSIVYVTKGGTMDYIFSLSEPAVAILAGGELVAWGRRWKGVASPNEKLLRIVAVAILVLFALGPGVHFYGRLFGRQLYELPARDVLRIRREIQTNSGPDDLILAPPYYAFDADRRLWSDYSELFIWTMKYRNEVREQNPDGEGWSKIREMAAALRARRIALAVFEMDQTGRIGEVMDALRDAYVPLPVGNRREGGGQYLVQTRNTRLGIFVPLDPNPTESDLAKQEERWRAFKADLIQAYGEDGVRKNFGVWFKNI